MAKKSVPSIDEGFFSNYAGSKKPYRKVWRQYCYFDECVALFKDPEAPRLKSIAVLGTATGEIAAGFYKKFGLKIYGCEVSAWAYAQTAPEFRARVKNQDMRRFVREQKAQGKIFTLVFSNSLIYLPESEIARFLKNLSRCTKYLHVKSSTSGSWCPDPYRQTLRPYTWWLNEYAKAGFIPVPGRGRSRTYLWRSVHTT